MSLESISEKSTLDVVYRLCTLDDLDDAHKLEVKGI